ncbi:MAG: TetR/AcrR family transcriptional regulator [Spirosomataceae bacterium]
MKTQDKIVEKALELFNTKGIEYVGMRELAAELDIRVGNITYYFPTKDDLVFRLSLDLAELNSKTIVQKEDLTISTFLEMLKTVFENQTQYRCLLLSFVHLMEQNPFMAERYKLNEKTRFDTWKKNLAALEKNGCLILKSKSEIDFLVSGIALISRFWISEATVSYRHLSIEAQIQHYLEMIARIIMPYASEKGMSEIHRFLVLGKERNQTSE